MKPKISVVIPCYNEEKYIGKCLESFQKQTLKDFEIIVVDNNCTDKTAAIARSYGAIVVQESKQGIIQARDRGFGSAKAEIIVRTDADSTVYRNWLKVIYEAFYKHPKVVAVTGPILAPTRKLVDQSVYIYTIFGSLVLGPLFSNQVYMMGPNMGVRRLAWEKISVHRDDKKLLEDVDLSIHLGQIGKILYLKQMKVVGSLRELYENPLAGLKRYLGDYGIRFIRTIWIHKQINKKIFMQRIRKIPLIRKNINYAAFKKMVFEKRKT